MRQSLPSQRRAADHDLLRGLAHLRPESLRHPVNVVA
jgi:hypothetical protein